MPPTGCTNTEPLVDGVPALPERALISLRVHCKAHKVLSTRIAPPAVSKTFVLSDRYRVSPGQSNLRQWLILLPIVVSARGLFEYTFVSTIRNDMTTRIGDVGKCLLGHCDNLVGLKLLTFL